MDAATVTATTVRLRERQDRTRSARPSPYDAATRTADDHSDRAAARQHAVPDRRATACSGGATARSCRRSARVFTTADLAPQALTTFDAAAARTWRPTWPGRSRRRPDLDQVIVRRNVGSKAPTPTTGTLVYAGTGTAVKNTGLAQGTTYTYAAWVKDRSGQLQPDRGQAVARDEVRDRDDVDADQLRRRRSRSRAARCGSTTWRTPGCRSTSTCGRRTSSTFKLLAALKTSSTGTLSATSYKPTVSSVLHADVPRQRGPDGHPDRGRHRAGRADDLGDAGAGVDPARRRDGVQRVRRSGARRASSSTCSSTATRSGSRSPR